MTNKELEVAVAAHGMQRLELKDDEVPSALRPLARLRTPMAGIS